MDSKPNSVEMGMQYMEYVIAELEKKGRFALEKEYMQHGTTTVYEHSLYVAGVSMVIAGMFNLDVDYESLIRGALLHDYFLYDWHVKDSAHRLHGLSHARTALKNAQEDYDLNCIEEDIILKHMFPLNLVAPRCIEAWIVCIADKYCAIVETTQPFMFWKRLNYGNK